MKYVYDDTTGCMEAYTPFPFGDDEVADWDALAEQEKKLNKERERVNKMSDNEYKEYTDNLAKEWLQRNGLK